MPTPRIDYNKTHVGAYMYDANTVEFAIVSDQTGERLEDGFPYAGRAEERRQSLIAQQHEELWGWY